MCLARNPAIQPLLVTRMGPTNISNQVGTPKFKGMGPADEIKSELRRPRVCSHRKQAHTLRISIKSSRRATACVRLSIARLGKHAFWPNAASGSPNLEEQWHFGIQLIVPVSSGLRHWLLPRRLRRERLNRPHSRPPRAPRTASSLHPYSPPDA